MSSQNKRNDYYREAEGTPHKDEEAIMVKTKDGGLRKLFVAATLAKEVTRLLREGMSEKADTLLSWFI